MTQERKPATVGNLEAIRPPTCGRIVHYFPETDAECAVNGADKVPAIVVQEFGSLMANLSVFPMNPDATNVLRYSVFHKSEQKTDGYPYWDWPEIK